MVDSTNWSEQIIKQIKFLNKHIIAAGYEN